MSLMAMLKKGGLRQSATAIHATFATDAPLQLSKVAEVAKVAVANGQQAAEKGIQATMALTASTQRPPGLRPKLLTASLALDAMQAGLHRDLSIVASGSPGQEARQEATRPWHHIEASWRELAAVYNQHHFACKTCQAAGQGRGFRCGNGAALWTTYQSAA